MSGEWSRLCEWQGCRKDATRHLTLAREVREKVTLLVCEVHYEVGLDHLRAGLQLRATEDFMILVQRHMTEL
jgi:hypothetical protein